MAVTTFTDLPNAAVQTGGRPRGSTITALRDNPIAIAECDDTAMPNRAAWHPFNRDLPNETGAVGRIYNFGTDGAVANVETPVFEDGFEYRIRVTEITPVSGTTLRIELRRQATGVYQGLGTLINLVSATDVVSGEVILPTVRRSLRMHFITGYLRSTLAGFGVAIQTATAVNLAQEITVADQIDRARLSFTSNMTGGAIFLERRRVYI
jgi:hypothetical protein